MYFLKKFWKSYETELHFDLKIKSETFSSGIKGS
jgi:hypothetical protein